MILSSGGVQLPIVNGCPPSELDSYGNESILAILNQNKGYSTIFMGFMIFAVKCVYKVSFDHFKLKYGDWDDHVTWPQPRVGLMLGFK